MGSRLDPALRRLGPALRKREVPLAALGVSAMGHALFIAGFLGAVLWGGWHTSKTYVVNLVPTVAAVGNPNAPAAPLPTRPTVPLAQRVPEPAQQTKETAPREARREAPQLPEPSLPTPSLPSRATTIRPGEKELPPLGGGRPSARGEKTGESRPAPTASLGLPSGSSSGAGALTLDVSDFPYAWYLRQVLQKVSVQWQKQNQIKEPGQKPIVWVEIQRDGSIRMPKIETTSGNSLYDQAALRAVMEASPFPPLPEDWSKPSLRVKFRFELLQGAG
jgi:periplasmic protein TonB